MFRDSQAAHPRSWRDRLYLGGWRLWALAGLALYSLLGFVAAPWIARDMLPERLGATLGREVRVETVRINPFMLSADIRGLSVIGDSGRPMLAFDGLYANFQLSSAFRRAWTFAEISLSGPYFEFVRYPDGTHSFGRLRSSAAPDAEAEAGATPRLIVNRLVVKTGEMDFVDLTLPEELRQAIGPIDFELTNLSTLPDRTADNVFVARTPQGTELRWNGEITLEPLASSGHLDLANGQLALPAAYLEQTGELELLSGRSDVTLDYAVSYAAGTLDARFDAINGTLADIRIGLASGDRPSIELPSVTIANASVAWPARSLAADRIAVAGARVAFAIEPDGRIDLIRYLLPDGAGDTGEPATAPATEPSPAPAPVPVGVADRQPTPWQFGLGELAVESFAVDFRDERLTEPFVGGIESLDLTVRELSSEAGASFPTEVELALLTGGRIQGNGTTGLDPLAAELAITIDDLSLPPAQAYARQRAALEISDGRLRFAGQLNYAESTSLRINGSGAVESLSARDLLRGEPFLAWDMAAIENLDVDLGRSTVAIESVDLSGPFLELTIGESGQTNLAAVFAGGVRDLPPDAGTEPAADEVAGGALALRIERIEIAGGTANFSDRTLLVPFAAGIYDLTGSIENTDTGSDAPSRLSLQGRVGESGEFLADGSLKLIAPTQALDISTTFRDLDLPLLTPYSTKFAGYEIARGRLSLDLDYRLAGEALEGDNNIVVEDLELGAQVESPTALDLPIKLAIGLLTDASGKIDLNLPVSGSLEDPEFSLSSMFGSVLGGVVRDAVTSPFRFLGGLIGSDDPAELSNVDFAAGSAELAPPERQKLARLAEALRQRPLLRLNIGGRYALGPDGRALREDAVDARVQALRDAAGGAGAAGQQPSTNPRLAALEALYLESLPSTRLTALRAANTIPARPATDESPAVPERVDETALANALREALVEAYELPPDALSGLASARAQAAAAFLAGEGALAPQSISILEPGATDDGVERIPLALELTSADDA